MNTTLSAKDYVSDELRNRRQLKATNRVEHMAMSDVMVCADGFKMSVQASIYHYSNPRENDGPWTEFEVGFPSEKEDLMLEYAEDENTPAKTVYAYVPAEVIREVIIKHGGLMPPG